MPVSTDEVLQLIYGCLSKLNSFRDPESQLELRSDTKLFGKGGGLDSLDVVDVSICLEECLLRRLKRRVNLVDSDDLSGNAHPFRDVSALATYLVKKCADAD